VRPVRIPADVEGEDRLLAGLTARQLAILSVGAVALWLAYSATRAFLPLPAFAALAFPIAASAGVLALGRRDGLSADRLALATLRHARSPRRMVPAPDGVPPLPPWLTLEAEKSPAPLELPARGIDPDGIVDLGPDGAALVCEASSINLGLRTEAEQDALVAAFGRFLNSVSAPLEIVIRAGRADLRDAVEALEEAAAGLPHPALESAAREHARFLAGLAARRDVLRRQVLVVLREQAAGGDVIDNLARGADLAASALAATGICLTPLGREEVAAVLARAVDHQACSRRVPGVAAAGADAAVRARERR
jgi:hypothetical protein